MRLGIVLADRHEAEMAHDAESHGLFGVLAGAGDARTAVTSAVYASTATDFARIVVRVQLGLEHPVTIAEELSVLDNVNNGRTVVLVDHGELAADDATDEVAVLREALGNRPIQHEGQRWKVPAGLPANATAPKAIAVTPKPAQIEIPFWTTIAREPAECHSAVSVQPGIARIEGSLKEDRAMVTAWAEAGATHLLLELPEGGDRPELLTMISRYLAPEVGMPHFPRVMSDSRVPLPWPGNGRA